MYISCQSLFLTAQICFLLVFKISHPLVLIILVCRRQTLFRLAHAFNHFFSPSPLYWFSGEALGCSWFICNASVSSKEVPQLFNQLASTTGARPSTPNRGLLSSATIAYARFSLSLQFSFPLWVWLCWGFIGLFRMQVPVGFFMVFLVLDRPDLIWLSSFIPPLSEFFMPQPCLWVYGRQCFGIALTLCIWFW